MSEQYEALPGGDGMWVARDDSPRHLQPVATVPAAPPIRRRQIKARRVELDGESCGHTDPAPTDAGADTLIKTEWRR